MSGTPGPAGSRVALVIANAGIIDTRVVKYAASLVEAGYEVCVLCHSPDGVRHEIDHVGARFVQLPVPAARRSGAGGRTALSSASLRRQSARAGRLARRILDRAATRMVPASGGSGRGSPLRRAELAGYRRWPWLAPWRRVCRTSVAIAPLLRSELDSLDPDLVHQHDIHEMHVTGEWVARRRAGGDRIAYVYDAREYVIGQPNPPARQVAAYDAMQREFISLADRVITVSEPIADQLVRDHHLARRPDVLVNATWAADDPHSAPLGSVPTVRQVIPLADDVQLLVYSGGLAPPRGVHTVVQALVLLPEVHLAVVARAESSYTRQLLRLAAEVGVDARVHIVPFVEPHQVVAYLSGGDLGLSPLLHAPNHDWALTNKFFEYLQAGLPMVTSDTAVQEELVLQLGTGTAFRAGDVTDCAHAIRAALDDLPALRRVVRDPALTHRLSWGVQSRVLLDAYRDLLTTVAPG